MSNIIYEQYEPSGVQGGVRGCKVNFTTEKIVGWNGRATTITEDTTSAMWVIKENLKHYKERDTWLRNRMIQTEIIRTPIEGGYRESKPPSTTLIDKYRVELCEVRDHLTTLKTLSMKYCGVGYLKLKMDELKSKWDKMNKDYGELHGGKYDDTYECDILLDQMRDIETTFKTLGFTVQLYK